MSDDSEAAEIVMCSSPQGSVIELLTDSSSEVVHMEETQNQSHITIGSDGSDTPQQSLQDGTGEQEDILFLSNTPTTPCKRTHTTQSLIVSSPEVPCAQSPSFRLRSPAKRVSPLKKKLNLLVTEQSFSIPNLLPSSPASSLYCTAKDNDTKQEDSQYTQVVTNVQYKGDIISTRNDASKDYKTRIISLKRSLSLEEEDPGTVNESQVKEVPPSSEDEGDVSLIEITRTVKKKKEASVVQVVSSPGFETLESSPITSPSKYNNAFDDDYRIPPSLNSDISTLDKANLKDTNYFESNTLVKNVDEGDNMEQTFDDMTMDQLRQKIIEYGLKPSNSRAKMLDLMKNLFKKIKPTTLLRLTQPESQISSQGFSVIKNSQNLIKFDIYDTLNSKFTSLSKSSLKEDLKLYEKIYTFQPIHRSALRRFFKNELDESDNDEITLKNWCDWNSICLIEEN